MQICTHKHPHRLTALTLFFVLLGGGGLAASNSQDDPHHSWPNQVWSAAMQGNQQALNDLLLEIPQKKAWAENAKRMQASLDLYRGNQSKQVDLRRTDRSDALKTLHEQFENNEFEKALATAVEVQSLSENFDSIFDEPIVKKLIEWADQQVPLVEIENDWLYARELLYLLRTLYEDTHRQDLYASHNEQLEQANQRVTLLALYAPHRLHDLRQKRAERRGEDPLEDFNPALAVDWRERNNGVGEDILRSSLFRAAEEHVEQVGWRTMLSGGLKALRIIATTQALEETFPRLGDPVRVNQWAAFLDQQLKELQSIPERSLAKHSGILLDRILEENLQTIDLPKEAILREFGDGATSELDRYSEIIWPDKLRRFEQATVGNFVGVGILIRHNEARDIMVVNPLEGAPAYYGGVKPDDLIMEVDGESTVGWSLNDAVDQITGSRNTEVVLGVKRDGIEGLIQIPLERKIIKIRSVKGWWKKGLDKDGVPQWDWMIDPNSRIAYIRLSQFTEDSYDDMRRAWREIQEVGQPNGVIFDLRFNPGGLLTSAVNISNLFLNRGVIVSAEDKNGHKVWPDHRARPGRAQMEDVPTIVLINRGSASASEIVSGCLQAHKRAIILGERSFGKGSVQTVHPIARNTAKMKLTTQYYRLPSPDGGKTPGRLVHRRPGATVMDKRWGVIPDLLVKMSDHQVRDAIDLRQKADLIHENGDATEDMPERPDVNRLITEGLDPQLTRALLILQAHALAETSNDEARVTANR